VTRSRVLRDYAGFACPKRAKQMIHTSCGIKQKLEWVVTMHQRADPAAWQKFTGTRRLFPASPQYLHGFLMGAPAAPLERDCFLKCTVGISAGVSLEIKGFIHPRVLGIPTISSQ